MFAENDKISGPQLKRMIVVQTLGISLMTSVKIAIDYAGRDGIFCEVVAIILTYLYGWLILYLCDKCDWNYQKFMKKYAGKRVENVINFVFFIKYICLITVLCCYFTKIVRGEILSEVNAWLVLIPVIILAGYMSFTGIEARARMMQVIYYFLLIPVAIFILISIKGIDKYYLAPFFMENKANIFMGAVWIFMIFSPLETILFSSGNIDASDHIKRKNVKKNVMAGIGITSFFNVIIFVLCTGKLSINYIKFNKEQSPVISVMKDIKMYGILPTRQEGIFLVFFIALMFFSIAGLLYYSSLMIRRMSGENVKMSVVNSFVIILAAAASVTLLNFSNEYSDTISTAEKKIPIEDRAFADTIIFDTSTFNFKVTITFWDESSESKNKNYTFVVSDPREVSEMFESQSDKVLDLSHTKLIVISDGIYNSGYMYGRVIKYLEDASKDNNNKETLSENITVISTKQTAEDFIKGGDSYNVPIGSAINDIISNNVSAAGISIHDLIMVDVLSEQSVILSEFNGSDKGLMVKGAVVVDREGGVEYFSDNGKSILMLAAGKKDFSVELGSTHAYRIKDNDYYIHLSEVGSHTIKAKIIYTGRLMSVERNDLSDGEINEILSTLICEKLTLLKDDYNCDILNIYKYLSVDNKTLYAMYDGRRSELYENMYIDVETRYKQ